MVNAGRKRTTGKGARPKLYERTAVSYQHKLEVLIYLDTATIKETVLRFYPELNREERPNKKRQFYAWKPIRATIEAKCSSGSRIHCRDRSRDMEATLPPAAEEQIVEWINALRSDGVPVTALMLKLQALEVYRGCQLPHGAFTATWSWHRHFLRRYKLAIRRRTRAGQTTSADAAATVEEFGVIVRDKMKELKISKVYNADQTGVNYEYAPTQTISPQGAKTVWVRCAGKTKERVMVMLLGDSDGNKLDPFLIFKKKLPKVADTARENAATRHGFGRQLWSELEPLQREVQIYGNSTTWWNSELSIAFLSYHFLGRPNMHEPVLLLWDDFSGHWRTDVLIFARLLNVELVKVPPPRYTYVCQPTDVAWNQPFKSRLRQEWVEVLVAQVRAAGAIVAFKMAPPTHTKLVTWIKDAWAALSSTTIKAGFRKARIDAGSQEETVAPPAPPCPEPDWGSMLMFLRSHEIATDTVDATKDIEETYKEAVV